MLSRRARGAVAAFRGFLARGRTALSGDRGRAAFSPRRLSPAISRAARALNRRVSGAAGEGPARAGLFWPKQALGLCGRKNRRAAPSPADRIASRLRDYRTAAKSVRD